MYPGRPCALYTIYVEVIDWRPESLPAAAISMLWEVCIVKVSCGACSWGIHNWMLIVLIVECTVSISYDRNEVCCTQPVLVSGQWQRTSCYLTFVGPCNVIYFYNKTNQMHNISNLFYFGTTLHVSHGLSVHHQESKTVSRIFQTGTVAAC